MQFSPLASLRPRDFDYWKACHLLTRAGFGGSPGQIRALADMGLNAAVNVIVDYHKVPTAPVQADDFDYDIVRPANAEERREIAEARQRGDEAALERFRMEVQRRQAADRDQMGQIQRWWLRRMIESPRPLEENLTLFWHGHFATSYRGTEDSYHMFLQNQFFRRNAAGNFADLVYGIIRDPAMLKFLNNDQNRRQAPNENLARELMELFTLGEGNVYTESDIREGARALTGYTFDDDAFSFREQWHDSGQKRTFNHTGNFDGDGFVQLILNQRAVSEFICLKLYRYFVNDTPGELPRSAQQFISRLAQQFRERKYDLNAVLKTLFKSAHFYDDANVGSVIKSPAQLIVQAVRSMHTPVRNLDALLSAMSLMGQNLFYPPSVKGWDGGRSWINTATLFVRQNIIIYLLSGQRPDGYAWQPDGAPFDAMHLVEHLRDPAGRLNNEEAVIDLLRFSLGTVPHPERVRTLLDFINSRGGTIDNSVLVGMLSLMAAMPEYQLC